MGWRREYRRKKRAIRNQLSSEDYNSGQFYRDSEDGMMYDSSGAICPGLVRYGGVRPGVNFKMGHGGMGPGWEPGGMYSPEGRATRSVEDTRKLKAMRLAEERHAGKGMGTTAGITPTAMDWIRAGKSDEYKSAQMRAMQYLRRARRETGGMYLEGGMAKPLPGGAVEFQGNSHEEGGIMLDSQTEVEDKETMDKVQGKDYFFSSHLKLGGKSFAKRHKDLLEADASQEEIDKLAKLQEIVSGRDDHDLDKEKEEFQDGGFTDIEGIEEEAKLIWEDPQGDHWNWDDEQRRRHHDYHFDAEGNPTTDTEKAAWKADNRPGSSEGSDKNWDAEGNYLGGLLFDNTKLEDWNEYREEAENITGIENFDFKNKEHISSLQNALMTPPEGSDPLYFSGRETSILEGEEGYYQAGVDGKGGQDTLKALKEYSEAEEEVVEGCLCEDGTTSPECCGEEEVVVEDEPCQCKDGSWSVDCCSGYGPDDEEIPDDEPVPGCPCEDGTISEECCEEQEPYGPEGCPCEDGTMDIGCCAEGEEEEEELMYNKPRKKFPWDTVLGVGAGLAQLIPAYMAMKEKPDFMGAPGRIPTVHLDRVAFNDARAANAANFHGMGRFIEQSGLGPGAIANKMAAWDRKQTGDMKITGEEARQNIGIENREEQLNLDARKQNIANRMHIDEFNAAARAMNKDRKLMGVQNAVQSLANMNRDRMMYKAERYKAGVIEGPTGVRSRYEREMAFRRANPNLPIGGEDYRTAWMDSELQYQDNPDQYWDTKKKWWKPWDKTNETVDVPTDNTNNTTEVPWNEVDADGDGNPDYLTDPAYTNPDAQRFGGPRFRRPSRKLIRRKKQMYG